MEQPRTNINVAWTTRDKLKIVSQLKGFQRLATYLEWHATQEINKANKIKK